MTYSGAPRTAADTGSEVTARLVECRHCHHASAFVFTDTYTCREQCVECGHKTLLGWASYREPVVILGSAEAGIR